MLKNKIKESYITKQECIAHLQKQLEEQQVLIEEQKTLIEKQKAIIENKESTIEHLNELLAKRNSMLFGRKSEKKVYIDDNQLSFFNEAETEADAKAEEPTLETVKSYTRKPKRTKEELVKDLPRKEVVIDLEDKDCGEGHTMTVIGRKKVRTEIEIIPEQISVTDYYVNVYKCEECEKESGDSYIVEAKSPTPVIKKSMASASTIAYVMQEKFQMGVPLYRQEQYWKQRGIELQRNTLANWIIKSSVWFEKPCEYIYKTLLSQKAVHADETTLRVLKKDGTSANKKSYMWVLTSSQREERQLAYYHYAHSRSKAVVSKLLGEYTGILHSDAYSSYDTAGKCLHQCCWVHSRRKYVDCGRGGKAEKVLEYISELYAVEKELKGKSASNEEILKARQEKSRPIFDELYEYIAAIFPKEGSKLADAVGYSLRHKTELATFLENPDADIDNNRAERAIKPFVMARKNFLFCDTSKGADASARVFTIIECAKLNNLDVYGYLVYLLTYLPRFGSEPTDEQLESVMPWNESVQKYCKV